MRPLVLPTGRPARQRGAVAIMVALCLLMLLGLLGLAVDSGKLYVNKAELQTAADACALAAAQELTCQPGPGITTCPAAYLQRAEAAGIYAGGRNNARLESSAVSISTADVRFSTTLGPNSGYLSRAAGANTNSRYAMCIARANGIAPWLMGVMGQGPTNVAGSAVATMAPGQTFCSQVPMGICAKAGGVAPNFGYNVGDWIGAAFQMNGNKVTLNPGSAFEWVDFTPNGGGNNEIKDQLAGRSEVCGLSLGQNVGQPGAQAGAKLTYNTRFGVYLSGSGEDVTTAPPDYVGYAYPNKSPGTPVINVGTSAYADYVRRRATNDSYVEGENVGNVISGQDVVATSAQLAANGRDARLVTAPIINCGGNNNTQMVGLACLLMLNPMTKGNNGNIYLEYRGNSTSGTSPCREAGGPGGSGGSGPLVPTLVE